MKTKSQVTLFIIIGIVILVLTIGFIYFIGSVKVSGSRQDLADINKIPSDLEPLINYFQSCLGNVAKKGLFLLGTQGGIIYTSQGGSVIDFPSDLEGKLYLKDSEGRSILYFISLPSPVGGFVCALTPPDYPVNITSFAGRPYPYWNWLAGSSPKIPDVSLGKEYSQTKCFGTASSIDNQVMMKYLKLYIDAHVKTDCTFSAFRNYMINVSDPVSQVKSNSEEIEISLIYPMTITNLNTGAKTRLENFKGTIKLSFDEFSSYINMIIRKDVDDPTYEIYRSFGDDFIVTLDADAYNHDDLIKIISKNFFLDGAPFTFEFARKNRYPVLEYIYNASFDKVNISVGEQIIWDEVILQNLSTVDPDEDNVTIKVMLGEGAWSQELTPTQPYTFSPGDVYNADPSRTGYFLVNITASDGQYSDYQIFKILPQP